MNFIKVVLIFVASSLIFKADSRFITFGAGAIGMSIGRFFHSVYIAFVGLDSEKTTEKITTAYRKSPAFAHTRAGKNQFEIKSNQ